VAVLLDRPRLLLHVEGVALLVAAVTLYFHAGYGWLLFAVLILAPDLSFAGYALGTRVGAASYNTLHTTTLPIALGAVGVLADSSTATAVALIWLSHIGGDRMLGYGLKYPSGFKDTHLQRV
jgi:hypothetical protein